MGMNYYEKLVMDDKTHEGYDLVKVDKGGFPDFKVFNFETGDNFWLEVKRFPELYTELQKKEFPKIIKKLVIAVVNKGKITYKDYKTEEVISTSSYSKLTTLEPNIHCDKCGHAWYTTTKMYYVSCPSCYKKIQVSNFVPKKEVVEEEVAGASPANDIDKAEKEFMKEYKENNDILLFNKAVDQFGKDRVKELLHKNAG